MASNIMIQRNRLKKLAGGLSDCRILYVQAPAGYGKTVFAGQWLEGRKEPNAVVSLDEYDNTAGDICYKLKRALEDICIEERDRDAAALIKHPGFDKAPAEFLMRALTAIPKDMKGSMVIDDLHYITDPGALKVLKSFLLRLPEEIKICLLSRGELPESFSGLVLKNELQFISQEQMLFDNSEIYELYKSKNIAVTKKLAEEVHAFTEGWPMGINALLLSGNHMPSENMSKEWLENFLKTQVWEMWDEESREFMVGTCMEDELTENLCNALTGKNNSGRMLEQLVGKGAFLNRQRGETYRFHNLFREFLKKQFEARPQEYRTKQFRAAGRWYLEQNDFYHAVERFGKIRDYAQMACCFEMLEDMDRAGFDTERVMNAVHNAIDDVILDQYPFLYIMMAFTARNEGRFDDYTRYADLYYSNFPRIVKENPDFAHNIFFMYAMDIRVTLQDMYKIALGTPASGAFRGVRGSATLYFPLYHRSFRDFSELLPGDAEAEIDRMGKILGPLMGPEYTMLRDCVCGGLFYEQGCLQRAHELALSAAAGIRSQFAPESKFCAMVLLLTVTHAMHQPEQEEIIRKDIQKMIEEDRAFYLQYNFDAVLYRNRLDSGDTAAAQKWIDARGTEVYDRLELFRLYGCFTDARAYIAMGSFNHAIILLEKIVEIGRNFKRPIDVIEAEILLAVSFWKKKRSNRKKALYYLEEAIKLAQPLGYEQAFINEGAELKNILSSLKNWTMRGDYSGELSGPFVKRLYIGAAEKAGWDSGRCGVKELQEIKFTRQQKRVAKLMCEGYSYRKIAEELGIRFSTVRSHIELIYRKLDVGGMDEAILKIRQLHLLE